MDIILVLITTMVVLFLFSYLWSKNMKRKESRNIEKKSVVPGPSKSDKVMGNFPDIQKAGSLHEYLVQLHSKYGDIVGFYWGSQFTVSVASPELFKGIIKLFDRPVILFKMFEILIGKKSIQYANGAYGQEQRARHDRLFNHSHIKLYLEAIVDIGIEQLCADFENHAKSGEPFEIDESVSSSTLKAALICLFGKDSVTSNEVLLKFKYDYDNVWYEMERRLTESVPEDSNHPRIIKFNSSLKGMHEFVNQAVTCREKVDRSKSDWLFIDELMDLYSEDREALISTALSYIVGGYHTTEASMLWNIYFLAKYPEYQDRLLQELNEMDSPEPWKDVLYRPQDFSFLEAIINESLRCGVVAPWGARESSQVLKLGGYDIEPNTPVIFAAGVMHSSPKWYPEPELYNPYRFLDKDKNEIAQSAFYPFGVGKRICPGYRFSQLELNVWTTQIVKLFRFELTDKNDEIHRKFALVTHPSKKIKINVKKRQE